MDRRELEAKNGKKQAVCNVAVMFRGESCCLFTHPDHTSMMLLQQYHGDPLNLHSFLYTYSMIYLLYFSQQNLRVKPLYRPIRSENHVLR